MNNKLRVYKMLAKNIFEAAEGGFGSEKKPDQSLETPPTDNASKGGFETPTNEELPTDSNALPTDLASSSDVSAEPSLNDTPKTQNKDQAFDTKENPTGEEPEEPEEEEEEKNPVDKSFDNFKKLATETEDSYDLLKFLKAELYDLKQDEYSKFLNKILRDKELKTKISVSNALLKLKKFFGA